jgi:hypothetical protein
MMKKIALILAVLAVVFGAGLFWLSGNLDSLVKTAIAEHGSKMTQARVNVEAVNIAPTDGKGTISNLTIGNPAGFKTSHAMKVGRIDVAIDIASVTKDVILVRHIMIDAPDVIYEKGETMTNFDAIQKNIADYIGPAERKKDAPGKKLIVEELTITNARAQASAAFMGGKTVSVPLPDISLKNIGKAKGGVTPGELGQEVAGALKAKLGSAVSFDKLMKSTSEALNKAGAAVKGLFQ